MNTFSKMAEEWIQAHLVGRPVEPPVFDQAAWLPEFDEWVSSECAVSNRSFGAIKSLHRHFSAWCSRSGSVPCDFKTFRGILREREFLFAEGLVSGLILAEDEIERKKAMERA